MSSGDTKRGTGLTVVAAIIGGELTQRCQSLDESVGRYSTGLKNWEEPSVILHRVPTDAYSTSYR